MLVNTKKRSIADLSAAFESKNTGGFNADWAKYFQFWKAPVDSTSTVRFLPDKDDDNSMSFLVENLTHELIVNGKKETVACLEMHGEECPICKLSRKYYDEKDPEHNPVLGKKYYRKKGYIGQVLVVESAMEYDQERLVHLIEFGPAIFKVIQAAFKSGDLEEVPYAVKGGYNFRIKKTKNGDYANYSTSSFSPKQTDVADDVIEAIELFDLKQYRTKKTDVATVLAMLEADRVGAALAPSKSNDDDEAPTRPATRPATTTTTATTTEGGETKRLSVVERLKLREQQAADHAE